MASLIYARRALRSFERLVDFAEDRGITPSTVVDVITDAVSVLARHPLIGRVAEHPFRELVISHGKSGYIALYRYDQAADRVIVVAIRAQREAGYRS
ncbi:MAG: type II toxin-antitoxin system RelE/ParE family toxin [Kofleriaceae bacterium]